MRWVVSVWLAFIFLGGLSGSASGAPEQQITPFPVEYTFGEQVNIRADIKAEAPIEEVLVFIRNQGDTERYAQSASLADGQIVYVHDLTAQPLRAFSTIEYWFEIRPSTGEPYSSPVFTFDYFDNRFDWQALSDGPFTVHWYAGDITFGQMVLNTAHEGLENARSLLNLPSPQPVKVYVYANGLDMQSTLRVGGLRWVAGHADPDLGVMVVSLPAGPDQRRETDRQIPHELMHILTYQVAGAAYYDLPAWLKEGLASANELRPNPDYYVILNSAVEKETLIPLSSLCQSFPQDTSVYLAYAEVDSFTRYLQLTYGSAGLQALVDAYQSGSGCEASPEAALGSSLSTLEKDWRRVTFGENAVLAGLGNLLPWITVLALILFVPMLLVLTGLGRSSKAGGSTRLPANR